MVRVHAMSAASLLCAVAVTGGCGGGPHADDPGTPRGRVAFSGPGGDLWVMDADGAHRRRVIRTPGVAEYSPRWSPDGRKLVFNMARSGRRDAGTIAVVDVDTGRLRRLLSRTGLSDVGWTPDGRRVVFGVQGQLFTAAPDGTDVSPLTKGGCPTFSPRGDLLIVCRADPRSRDGTLIVALPRHGGRPRTVFSSADYATPGGFSPDGRRLVISAGPGSQSDVFVVDVATGRTELLLRKGGSQNVEGWLQDGTMVLADTDGITGRTAWRLLNPRDRTTSELRHFHAVGDPVDWWSPGRPAGAAWPARAPGRRAAASVRVDGRLLAYTCSGHGRPTVVLDSGLGVRSDAWKDVQRRVARTTRVCRYDRAGNGLSDPAQGVRDSRHAVRDLVALLRGARLATPIVAVGASFGGLDAQLLAATHRRLVAGLVLVDSLHPRLDAEIERLLPAPLRRARRRELARNTEGLSFADIVRSEAQVRRAENGHRSDVPRIVLRHGLPFEGGPAFPSARVEALWTRLQRDLARRSTRGTVIVAARSQHRIADSRPDLVADAIRRLVRDARSLSASSARCAERQPCCGRLRDAASADPVPTRARRRTAAACRAG